MTINPRELADIDPRCEFHYPYAWRDIAPMLLSGDPDQVREAVAQLEARDRALEDHLTNRPCCECIDDGSS